ncbi:hypothetical protein [Staphylococcus edaphicus]|uniref:Uncharacterized protein n=1 Tax=Staphylococcus edaphicus TaxID=1955013 RepID=A0A2C6WLM4_9STAP|nr:hypothetical protein [Staphylococcus edaphicus]PHK49043.1 hypothetical protein BTJ66_10490 [Staphylococcus edaphicus]UQW81370.1 hypothetical protein MNY58_12545 [Staphylococcus edaphicus]
MWKNIEISVSLIILIGALIFAIYSFYANSIAMGVGALIVALVNCYYMIKEWKEKRDEDYLMLWYLLNVEI